MHYALRYALCICRNDKHFEDNFSLFSQLPHTENLLKTAHVIKRWYDRLIVFKTKVAPKFSYESPDFGSICSE